VRAGALDTLARAVCVSRLYLGTNLPFELAQAAANDVIDEYVRLTTGRPRC
jgi:hypothetical protein